MTLVKVEICGSKFGQIYGHLICGSPKCNGIGPDDKICHQQNQFNCHHFNSIYWENCEIERQTTEHNEGKSFIEQTLHLRNSSK